jgi:AraC-like DNA-binding protein
MWALPYSWLRRETAGAVRQGLSFDYLMSESLIDLQYRDDRDVIGPAQAVLLCMNTVLALQDSAHGLANASIVPRHSELGLRIALGSATLEASINSVTGFYHSVCSAVRFNLQNKDDTTTLSIMVDAPNTEDAIQLEEIYLTWLFMHCIYFLGRSMPIIDVMVRDPAHFNMGQQHFGIGAPVRYGPVTSFRFARSLLGARSVNRAGDNPHLEAALLWLDFVQGEAAEKPSIIYLGEQGFTRLKDIAEERSVSRSTIRRRLQSVDGGFRGARERALVKAATRMLISSDESVEAISAELGYADARNFRRFFKNATGLTPQQARARSRDVGSVGEQRVLDKLAIVSARFNS